MIKLVAFDWNGTLLADTKICWQACLPGFKIAGVNKPISLLKWRKTYNIPYIECLIKNGADRKLCIKNSKKISEVFHTIYEKSASGCRTRSGTSEILAWIRNQKIQSMIYSNHTVDGIEKQLKRLGIREHLHVI